MCQMHKIAGMRVNYSLGSQKFSVIALIKVPALLLKD